MRQWDFVIAVYAIGIIGTLGLVLWCTIGLRRRERELDEVKRK